MEFPRQIFRAYDIRGLMKEVTPEIAHVVGRALVAKLSGKVVLVGRDMRETSPMLSESLIEGITNMGADVIDMGLTTTSMFNFALTTLGVDIGAMVTASHNPAEYNGIKVTRSSGDPVSGLELYDLIQDDFPDAEEQGNVEKKNVVESYLRKVLNTTEVPDLTGTKVVVDYGNGMGSLTVRPLLEKLGITVVELYAEPDATFPNHEANPANEETLVDLKKTVIEEGADFGIALDGDVDRMKIIDNEGVSIPGDLFLALISKEMLENHPGRAVVVTVNMGWAVREAIKESGGDVVESAVGRTNVIKAARASNAIVGGETSGHVTFSEFSNLEIIDYGIIRTFISWKKSGKSMADLVRPLRKYANSGDVNNEVEDKDSVLKKIEETYQSKAKEINTMDGVKCVFEDWWFIVRASNTEPVIRLTVEAKTQGMMNEKVKEVIGIMKTV